MPVKKDNQRGTWEVKFSYRNYAGEKKWVHKRGFAKKSDAQQWEIEKKLKVAGSNDMILKDFIDIYISYITPRIRQTTLITKMSIINTWIIPYLGSKPVNQITTADIIKWQNTIIESYNCHNKGKHKKSYLKAIHSTLSAIMNHAYRFYNLTNNPCQIVGNMGHQKDTEINFWTLEEYMKFREVAMDHPIYYYLFEILYWCGIRIGELLALEVSDINLEAKTISITKGLVRVKGEKIIGPPKTRKSKREVVMPDFLADELQDYLSMIYEPTENGRLFDFNKSSISRFLKRGAKKAGIKEITVHSLRHSHASLLIDKGFSVVSIADRLGHESSGMTLHYSHLFPNAAISIANELDKTNKEEKGETKNDKERKSNT